MEGYVKSLGHWSGAHLRKVQAGVPPGTPCGLENLHRIVGPLPEGTLTVLGAPTGVGKSSVALMMVLGLAKKGIRAGYVSVEDSPAVFVSRAIAAECGIDSARLMRGDVRPEEWPEVAAAQAAIERMEADVDFPVGGSAERCLASVIEMGQRGCKLVVLDYAQAISFDSAGTRRLQIGAVAVALKQAALEHGFAAVLVSQLARPDRPDRQGNVREPSKHDLKEAGELENAAEVILLLRRNSDDDEEPVWGRVVKCTWGGGGRQVCFIRDRSGTLREKPMPTIAQGSRDNPIPYTPGGGRHEEPEKEAVI